jgi:hypothetical protein
VSLDPTPLDGVVNEVGQLGRRRGVSLDPTPLDGVVNEVGQLYGGAGLDSARPRAEGRFGYASAERATSFTTSTSEVGSGAVRRRP